MLRWQPIHAIGANEFRESLQTLLGSNEHLIRAKIDDRQLMRSLVAIDKAFILINIILVVMDSETRRRFLADPEDGEHQFSSVDRDEDPLRREEWSRGRWFNGCRRWDRAWQPSDAI